MLHRWSEQFRLTWGGGVRRCACAVGGADACQATFDAGGGGGKDVGQWLRWRGCQAAASSNGRGSRRRRWQAWGTGGSSGGGDGHGERRGGQREKVGPAGREAAAANTRVDTGHG